MQYGIKRQSLLLALSLVFLLFGPTSFLDAADVTLSWTPNIESDLAGYKVYHGTTSRIYGTAVDIGKQTSYVVTGLGLGTHYFALTAYDTSGAESGFSNEVSKVLSDTTAPIISGVRPTNLTSTGVVIIWNTNKTATSQVEYGASASYGITSALDTTLTASHSTTLRGLPSSVTFHYRVKSTDAAGNLAVSGDQTFTTPAAPEIPSPAAPADTTPPADVQNFSAVPGDQKITLQWTNPPDSDFAGVLIRFRTDHFPEDINEGELLGDFAGQPNQTMTSTPSGLQNNVTYYYSASSYDSHGNYQSTAHASASPFSSLSQSEQPENPITTGGGGSGGGGCAMISPRDGNPPGPEQAAEIPFLVGIVLLALLKKKISFKGSSKGSTAR
jgi:hypothetical protein